jgi:hypothetical protein
MIRSTTYAGISTWFKSLAITASNSHSISASDSAALSWSVRGFQQFGHRVSDSIHIRVRNLQLRWPNKCLRNRQNRLGTIEHFGRSNDLPLRELRCESFSSRRERMIAATAASATIPIISRGRLRLVSRIFQSRATSACRSQLFSEVATSERGP